MEKTADTLSFVQYLSYDGPTSCGYCKEPNGSKQHGLWAFKLNVEDYQDLIDRGWRRCGHYCYKPILSSTCCPMYTIRCDASDFRLSKSQKRNLKRMNAFLLSGDKGKAKQSADSAGLGEMNLEYAAAAPTAESELLSQAEISQDLKTLSRKRVTSLKGKKVPRTQPAVTDPAQSGAHITQRPLKAKQMRINRKREKLRNKGFNEEEIAKKMTEKKRYSVRKNVEDFIDVKHPQNAKHVLELKLVRSSPRSGEFNETYEAGYSLFRRYQMAVHKDPADKVTRKSYDRFLVDSPLREESEYGSFHQQYWLDGKLIAVGVLDILPFCVSSVYLFYDPDYSFLCLGTYGALRELHLVRSLKKSHLELEHYYMGYYIRTCPKMRYKGAFKPSFLLCPEAYTWHSLVSSLPKIDLQKYARLNDDPGAKDEDGDSEAFEDVLVIYKRKVTLVSALPSLRGSALDLIKEYCSLVGSSCARRMVLQLS